MPKMMIEAGVDDSAVKLWQLWMTALRNTQPKLLAYLSYMTERLLAMKSLLKPTGSIYLHCDPTASHYIKVLMDGIFGHQNFLNEIIWYYGKWTNAAAHFQKNHDVILVYCRKRGKHIFNKLFNENSPQNIKYARGWDSNVVEGGIKQLIVYDREKARQRINSDSYNRIIYREETTKVAMSDVWQIPIINSQSKERLGYPTQKPIALLKRIIEASSNIGDVVFDPFCGCATTIVAAHELKRKWIGIDIAYHAIKRVVQSRLYDRYQLIEDEHYEVAGIPSNREAALDLWKKDKYQFQRWAIETVDGFVTPKRTNDGGIDGRIFFSIDNKKTLGSMIVEVKGGHHIGRKDLHSLKGVLQDSDADMAGLIIRDELGTIKTRNFQKLIASSGFLGDIPKIQILTLDEILNGKKFRTPYLPQAKGKKQGVLNLDHT
jgi:site-specific DNA-methyltransferase (adenine-specific)